MAPRSTAPFRAEHVGSFLRPERLMQAREQRDAGELDAAALREVEDEWIREVVQHQEDVGLSAATDGEFRRTYFHVDFLDQLEGVDVREGDFLARFRRNGGEEVSFRPPTMKVTGPLRHQHPIQGDDPDELTRLYCRLVNDAVRDRPADMAATVHLCRGNFKSAWVARGGYDPVAEILFEQMDVDGFFLEYDDERSGDFAPLRHMPGDKVVVLGLMSSKKPDPEPSDDLVRRIEEASQYVDLDQCAISHQCGFSSTAHGNALGHDDQWRKLERTVEVAERVWG